MVQEDQNNKHSSNGHNLEEKINDGFEVSNASTDVKDKFAFHERKKFDKIHDFINNEIYFGNTDIHIADIKYNSALLLGMLTCVNNGKLLYVGDYGLGKTSLAEIVSSVLLSVPRGLVEFSGLRGHPQINYDEIVGRSNLKDLKKGNENAIWSRFVFSPVKILDELNRIPEDKQNILLSNMQSNRWVYLNDNLKTESVPWFATKNHSDDGTGSVIPPLLDRFDLSVEIKYPGTNNLRNIRYANEHNLYHHDLEQRYVDFLKNKPEYVDVLNFQKSMQSEFRDFFKKNTGLDLLSVDELNNISSQIKRVPFSLDANLFLDVYFSETSSCQTHGQKREGQSCVNRCPYSVFSCSSLENNLSVRTVNAIDLYAKSLAWLTFSDEVHVEHVKAVIPFAVWHKNVYSESFLKDIKDDVRVDALNFYAANKIVNDVYDRFKFVRDDQIDLINRVQKQDFEGAKALAEKQSHPIFKEYLKE